MADDFYDITLFLIDKMRCKKCCKNVMITLLVRIIFNFLIDLAEFLLLEFDSGEPIGNVLIARYIVIGFLALHIICSVILLHHLINVKNGETETKNGETETKNGETETKKTKNGETETKNGETETKNGETETKNGETETKNGKTETKNGETETKNGETETKNGETETKNGETKIHRRARLKLFLFFKCLCFMVDGSILSYTILIFDDFEVAIPFVKKPDNSVNWRTWSLSLICFLDMLLEIVEIILIVIALCRPVKNGTVNPSTTTRNPSTNNEQPMKTTANPSTKKEKGEITDLPPPYQLTDKTYR